METWTIALACIFVLGALALGLSMRPVSTPTASEFAQVSEAPLAAAPVTPEITVPEVAPAAPAVVEKAMPEQKAPEMEVSKSVVQPQLQTEVTKDIFGRPFLYSSPKSVAHPATVPAEENPYPETTDIDGMGG